MERRSPLRPIDTEGIRQRAAEDKLSAEKLAEILYSQSHFTAVDRRIRYLLFKADQAVSQSRPGQRLFKERPSTYARLVESVFNAYWDSDEDLPPRSR